MLPNQACSHPIPAQPSSVSKSDMMHFYLRCFYFRLNNITSSFAAFDAAIAATTTTGVAVNIILFIDSSIHSFDIEFIIIIIQLQFFLLFFTHLLTEVHRYAGEVLIRLAFQLLHLAFTPSILLFFLVLLSFSSPLISSHLPASQLALAPISFILILHLQSLNSITAKPPK